MKVVIVARDFDAGSGAAIEKLKQAGYEIEECKDHEFGVGSGEEELYERIKDADVVIAGLEPYTEHLLSRCPKLKLISRRGIGYDSVDTAACRKFGITLARTTGEVEAAVAEHVLAYILYFARSLHTQSADMHRGLWNRCMHPGAKGRTIGLVGFGGIGKEIAKRANVMDMRVLYYCRHPKPEWEGLYGASYRPLEELLAESDYVSANIPLTKQTENFFGEKEFAQMKEGSYFINIDRSPVADNDALKKYLLNGHLCGAALDVFPHEQCTDSVFIDVPNVILTPHTASYTMENFVRMNEVAAQNVIDFAQGKLEGKYKVV